MLVKVDYRDYDTPVKLDNPASVVRNRLSFEVAGWIVEVKLTPKEIKQLIVNNS